MLRHPIVVDRSFFVSRDHCIPHQHRRRTGRSPPNEQKALFYKPDITLTNTKSTYNLRVTSLLPPWVTNDSI